MKEKIQQLAQNLSEDEAALLFQLLLKSFEIDLKNVPAEVIERLLGLLK